MGLQAIESARSDYEAARLLFQDLCDDELRIALFRELTERPRVLRVASRAEPEGPPHALRPAGPVYLLSRRAHILAALSDADRFSNQPYQALGSGQFMLALDGAPHAAQRAFGEAMLRDSTWPSWLNRRRCASSRCCSVLPPATCRCSKRRCAPPTRRSTTRSSAAT